MKIPHDDDTEFETALSGNTIKTVFYDRTVGVVVTTHRLRSADMMKMIAEMFPDYARESRIYSEFNLTTREWTYRCSIAKRMTFRDLVEDWGREEALKMVINQPE